MQGLHKGVVNKDLHNVHMVVNKDLNNVHMVASFLRHKWTTDCAEVRMTSANRDTLCATMTRFVAVYSVGARRGVCKVWRMIVEPAATTDHHDAPTLCRRTPNLRPPAYSKRRPHPL